MKKLDLLRLYFIIYFIAKIIVDIVLGSHITNHTASYLKISQTVIYTFTILINFILFLIGLLVFYFLLKKRNWARIVLLIIGWLAVLDFISSLFLSSKIGELLTHIDRLADWDSLILIDRITDIISLIYWGFAIYILQFNNEVKDLFLSTGSVDSQEQKS